MMAVTERDKEMDQVLAALGASEAERQHFFASTFSSFTSSELIDKLSQWGSRRWGNAQAGMEEVEQNTLAFLENLGEADPRFASEVAKGWMDRTGDVSGRFKAEMSKLTTRWQQEMAAEQAADQAYSAAAAANPTGYAAMAPAPKGKRRLPQAMGSTIASPSIVPGQEPQMAASSPSRPGDPRNRPEDAIKNADRIMRKLVGGEEAGG
jgi:hypothetical protein